jgi:hypothetical protein
MRLAGIIFLAGLMAAPASQAADLASAALAPGNPAGIHKAQLDRDTVLVVAGGVVLVAGFAVLFARGDNFVSTVISGGNNNGITTVRSTNSSTSTS